MDSMKAIMGLVVFLIVSIPSAQALEAVPAWGSTCFNSTDIHKVANITDISDGSSILDAEMILPCPYGCDQNRDICWKWPGNAVSGEYFMMFELFTIILMMFVFFRLDSERGDMKILDVIVPLLAAILFAILALQGNNVIDMSTGEAVPVTMVIWFDFGMIFLMVSLFFFNLYKFAQEVIEEGGKL